MSLFRTSEHALEEGGIPNAPSQQGWFSYHGGQLIKLASVVGVGTASYFGFSRWWSGPPAAAPKSAPAESLPETASQDASPQTPSFNTLAKTQVDKTEMLATPLSANAGAIPVPQFDRADTAQPVSASPERSQAPLSLAQQLGISYGAEDATEQPRMKRMSTPPVPPIPLDEGGVVDAVITQGEEFSITLPGNIINAAGQTRYFSQMSVSMADGSPIPSWMQVTPPPIPFAPQRATTYFLKDSSGNPTLTSALAVEDQRLFVVDNTDSLQVMDKTTAKLLSRSSARSLNVSAVATLAVQGDFLFLGDRQGFHIYTNASGTPAPLLFRPVPGGVADAKIEMPQVAISDLSGHIWLGNFDVNNPTAFYFESNITFPYIPFYSQVQFDIEGDLLAAIGGSNNHILEIYDAKTSSHPQLGSINVIKDVIGISLQGKIVSLSVMPQSSTASPFFTSVDASNLPNLQPIANISLSYAGPIYPAGGFQFILSGSNQKVPVIVETDGKSPAIANLINLIAYEGGLIAQGGTIYVQDDNRNAVQAFDFSPWAWEIAGIAPPSGTWNIVAKADDGTGVVYQQTIALLVNAKPVVEAPQSNIVLRPGQTYSERFDSDLMVDPEDGRLVPRATDFSIVGSDTWPRWLSLSFNPIVDQQTIGNYPGILLIQNGVLLIGNEGISMLDPQSLVPIARLTVNSTNPLYITSMVSLSSNEVLAEDYANRCFYRVQVTVAPTPALNVTETISYASGIIATYANVADTTALYGVKGNAVLSCDLNTFQILDTLAIPDIFVAAKTRVYGNSLFALIALGKDVTNSRFYLYAIDKTDPLQLQIKYVADLGTSTSNGQYTINDFVIDNQQRIYLTGATLLQGLSYTDTNGFQPIAGINQEANPIAIATQGDNFVVVADQYNGISLIDTSGATPTIVYTTPQSQDQYGSMAIYENKQFVGSHLGNTLYRIDVGFNAWQLQANPGSTVHDKVQVQVVGRDSQGAETTTQFTVVVNNPPVVKGTIPPLTLKAGQSSIYQLLPVFSDPDNDPLTYNATACGERSLSPFATFTANPYQQTFILLPQPKNRGNYTFCIDVNDGYFGTAKTQFSVAIPNQAPQSVRPFSMLPAQVWLPYSMSTPEIVDPEGDALTFGLRLPSGDWLCVNSASGELGCSPSFSDYFNQARTRTLIVRDAFGAESEFELPTISIGLDTFVRDLTTYWAASGLGLVAINLAIRTWRSVEMGRIRSAIRRIEARDLTDSVSPKKEEVEKALAVIFDKVQECQSTGLLEAVQSYVATALRYVANDPKRSVMAVGNLRTIIDGICDTLERRTLQGFGYSESLVWVEALHGLLQLLVETENGRGRAVLKADKEKWLKTIKKAIRFVKGDHQDGALLKSQLVLCRQALVSMDDTDAVKNCFKEFGMAKDILQSILPLYGIYHVAMQFGNVPDGWYPAVIRLHGYAQKTITDIKALPTFQKFLAKQDNWAVIFYGVKLLGDIGRTIEDDSIRARVITALEPYQQFNRFRVQRCDGSIICENRAAWIREQATAIVETLGPKEGAAQRESKQHVAASPASATRLSQAQIRTESPPTPPSPKTPPIGRDSPLSRGSSANRVDDDAIRIEMAAVSPADEKAAVKPKKKNKKRDSAASEVSSESDTEQAQTAAVTPMARQSRSLRNA